MVDIADVAFRWQRSSVFASSIFCFGIHFYLQLYALFGSIKVKKSYNFDILKKIRTKVARACFDQYSVISVLNWILPLLYLTVFSNICLIKILSSLEINIRKVLFVKTRNLFFRSRQSSTSADEITRENEWSQTISKKFEIQKKP